MRLINSSSCKVSPELKIFSRLDIYFLIPMPVCIRFSRTFYGKCLFIIKQSSTINIGNRFYRFALAFELPFINIKLLAQSRSSYEETKRCNQTGNGKWFYMCKGNYQ